MPKFDTTAAFTITVTTIIEAESGIDALRKLEDMVADGTIKLEIVLDTSFGAFVLVNAGEGTMSLEGVNRSAFGVVRIPDFPQMEVPSMRDLIEAERHNLDIGRD